MPAEGARFGDYLMKRRLARGGMGEIWLAERLGISGFTKQVVIKTILEAYTGDERLVEMFLREGRIAAELNHPNIAQTFDLGCIDGIYYMAMELVDGRDLREILIHNVEHGTRVPLGLVLRIMSEVCQGLYYAHTRTTPDGRPAGIIHRDISPQNIIVTFDGGVKIIDFGVAKAEHMASLTRSGVLKGKYAYMSPEQIRGDDIDGRSDIFSAGVVLYELITCRRLFKRNSEVATLEAVMRDPIPLPAYLGLSIPGPVESILEKALERDRQHRFQDARQMQTALERAMLRCNLVSSSTHLSEYMKGLFPEGRRLAFGREISRRMERIPSVSNGRAGPQRRGRKTTAPERASASGKDEKRGAGRKKAVGWPALVVSVVLVAFAAASLVWLWRAGDGARYEKSSGAGTDRGPAGSAGGASDSAKKGRSGFAMESPAPAVAGRDGQDANVIESGDSKSSSRERTSAVAGDEGEKEGGGTAVDGAGQKKNRLAAAKRRPRWALLDITTNPGAEIIVDGKKRGAGDARVRLVAGWHAIQVRMGQVKKSRRVRLKPGGRKAERIYFAKGRLKVVVHPYADVYVNGRHAGQSPMAPLELWEGTYRLRLVNAELGKSERLEVRVEPDKTTSIVRDWR